MFFSPGVLEEGSEDGGPTTNRGQIKATPKNKHKSARRKQAERHKKDRRRGGIKEG